MKSRRRRSVRRSIPAIRPTAEILEIRQVLSEYSYGVTTHTPIVYRPTSNYVGTHGEFHFSMTPVNTVWNYVLLDITTSPPEKSHTFELYVNQVSPENLWTGSGGPFKVPSHLIVVPLADPPPGPSVEMFGDVLITLTISDVSHDSPGLIQHFQPNTSQILIKSPKTEDPGPNPEPPPNPVVPPPQIPFFGSGFCGPKPQADSTSLNGFATPSLIAAAGNINAFTGAVSADPLTLYSGGFGKDWGLATDWTSTFAYSAGGTVGRGFVNLFQPTIQQTGGGGLRVVKSATDVQWFESNGSGGFTASFDGREKLVYESGPDEYVLTDDDGGVTRFYGFGSSVPALQQGRFKSYADPYRAAVTTPGDVSHLITTVYDVNGRMTSQQRSDGAIVETYNYYYVASGVNAGLLDHATLSRTTGGSPTVVRQARFKYYDGSNTGNQLGGNAGDLQLEEILDATGTTVLDATYFRYYTSNGPTGFTDGLKYVFHYDAYARLAADAAIGDELSAGDAQIAKYADAYYEYDQDRRVTKAVLQGEGCSCSGSSGAGEYTYSYYTSPYAGIANGDFNRWRSKTVETLPDGNRRNYYFNFAGGLVLHASSIVSDDVDGSLVGKVWATSYRYDAQGRLIQTAQPSAVAITTASALTNAEANSDLVGYAEFTGGYQYLRPSAGLIDVYEYGSSTTAGASTPGDVSGYLKAVRIKQGYTGSALLVGSYQYTSRTAAGSTIYVLASETTYRNANGTGARTTSYSYAWVAGTLRASSLTVTHPVVGAAQNGSGVADSETFYYDSYGRQIWAKDAGGFLHYTQYDVATGAVVRSIIDVDTARTDLYSGAAPATTPNGGGLNLVSTYQVDALGRVIAYTDAGNRTTRWVYKDVAREIRTYRGWDAATGTTTGPIEITRVDYAGNYVETITIAKAPSLTGSTGAYAPTGGETFAMADVRSLVRSRLDLGGRVVEENAYFNLAGLTYTTSTSLGSVGTHYYATKYGYDHRGRLSRVVDAVGTISSTAHDALGRVVTVAVGTADGFGGTGTSNMTVVARYEYDGGAGAVGDGNLTRSFDYPDGEGTPSTARVSQYAYDWRNRLVAYKLGVQSSESEDVQRRLFYFDVDHADQVTAVSEYDGDTIAPSTSRPSDLRLRAYATYAYDDQGRAYEQRVYHVDPVNGGAPASNATNYLKTSTFYEARGYAIATYSPGGLASKARYDGAGRLVSAAETDGAAVTPPTLAAAAKLDGDHVLTETRIRYNGSGDPILTTVLDRQHDAAATGPLYAPGTSGPADGGFESVVVGSGSSAYAYSPSGTPWTFEGSSGISGNGSAFTSGNKNAPEGGHVAFLQGNGSISQTRADWEAGQYTVTFKAARRGNFGAAQTFKLVVDGQDVSGAVFTPSTTTYDKFSATFTLAAAGRHTIKFVGVSAGSDASFIDDVAITPAATAWAFGDPGFENSAVAAGVISGHSPQPSPSWTVSPGAGVASSSSAFFTGAPVPASIQGDLVLYLQDGGAARHDILALEAGTYTISFRAVQRQNVTTQNQTLQVKVASGVGASMGPLFLVGTYKPSSTDFETYTATFTLNAAGDYTFQINGTAVGDHTAFVDSFSIAKTSARATYEAFYYDPASRLIQSVDVGTNGGRAYERPTTSPTRSDVVLITSYLYDDAGRLAQIQDPRSVFTRMSYDALGRVVETVQNAPALPSAVGAVTSTANNTTRYTYNGLGQILTVTGVMPTGSTNQVTTYTYGVSPADGSALHSNGLLRSIAQPDGATTSYAYNALGQTVKATDPNGTVHQYAYDVVGRFRSDAVVTLGSGVDGAVRRLETAYDSAGRAYLFTSYDAASGGSIVDQVKNVFNGYGQLLTEYQSHAGAVVDATTSKIQYAYSTPNPDAVANYSRLISKTYPNGRVLGYIYDVPSEHNLGIDSRISRISSIVESAASAVLESYAYLGLGTIVERAQLSGGLKLTYIRQTGDAAARDDGGDRYTGLDRFGRVIDQNWVRTAAAVGGAPVGSSTVRLQYGYDRAGNALYRRDLVNTALSELYQYDSLDRLTSMKRGVLSAANNAIASPTFEQSWSLDARGNQASATTNGATVSKTFNEANEVASVSDGTAPSYDAAGNTTTNGGRSYVYDAWNRLKAVKEGLTTIASYAYDALFRRTVETAGGQTAHVYFDGGSKAVEDRVGGAGVGYHYVVGLTGDVVFRDVYSNIAFPFNGDWRTYAQTDVNGNVVALVGNRAAGGEVVERYVYAPYGAVSILDAAGAAKGSSPYQWKYLFQGGALDAATGLYHFGFRAYDPNSGVWMQRDPIGLAGGDLNVYRFVGNNPINYVDPTGLSEKWFNDGWTDWINPFAYIASHGDSLGERIGSGYGEISTLNVTRDMAMDRMARDRVLSDYNHNPLNVDLMKRIRSTDASRTLSDLSSATTIIDGGLASVELASEVGVILKSGTAGLETIRSLGKTSPPATPVTACTPNTPSKPSPVTKRIELPETTHPSPVKPSNATQRWEEFLGPGKPTNIHPRTGKPDPDLLVSPDGKRSIRYGNHEMNSNPTKHHYHEQTWDYNSSTDTMTISNTIVRVPLPKAK